MIFSQELQLPFLSCCCNLLVLTILALQTCLIPSIENTKHKTFSSTHPTFLWSAVKWKSLSCVQLFASPWTIQSVEFSRPEYWSGQPFCFCNLEEARSKFWLFHLDVCLRPLSSSWTWKLLNRVWLFVTPETVLYSPWNSLGQNTRLGSFSLLQGIFPT